MEVIATNIVFVFIKIVNDEHDSRVQIEWVSPSGKITNTDFFIDGDWVTTWKAFERKADMEEGEWQCRFLKKGKTLIEKKFRVSNTVALINKYEYKQGPTRFYFGIKDAKGFRALNTMHPNESVVAFSQINPYDTDKTLQYEWISPSHKKYAYTVPCQATWNYTWLLLSEGQPMEEGIWKIKVYDGKTSLIESTFTISEEAELYMPYAE